MSDTSTLISCNGRITRAELAKLPTPQATATHVPIPHAAVVKTLVETLAHRHIGVVGEEFAVSSDGWKCSASLTWKPVLRDADLRLEFETQTTNDSGWHARSAYEYSFATILHFEETTHRSWQSIRDISRSKTRSQLEWTGCKGTSIRCGYRSTVGEHNSCRQRRQS